MPSSGEFSELVNYTDKEWVTIDGVSGLKCKSKVNDNYIFLPAAGNFVGPNLMHLNTSGYYWSISYVSAQQAKILLFNSSSSTPDSNDYRFGGFAIRPIKIV